MPGPIEVETIVAGRYTLERRISAGGIGSLWLARDEQSGETCALRVADEIGHNTSVLDLGARYRAEFELIERIRCENVVDIMDYGDWRGMPYLVAEYLPCEDLASRLRKNGQHSPELAYRIIAHTARALARAHASGIVHGDVTPENILVVDRSGEPLAKLHNFGLTQRSFEHIVGTVTRIGAFVRLPHYASPEQTSSAPLDHRSDLWSLGVIAYECLTGRKPFESNVYGDLVAKILCAPYPELKVAGCKDAAALQAWFERSCAREAPKRFQSAKAMSDELGNALGLPLIYMPEASPSVAPGFERAVQKAMASETTQASVRKQSFQQVPRKMTPLGIGAVNPNLISATPPPAWSTREVSSELHALEAQRLASEQPSLDIPKAPRVPNLGTPVARIKPAVASTSDLREPVNSSTSEYKSEAPTMARRQAAQNATFGDSEGPTLARREGEPSAAVSTGDAAKSGAEELIPNPAWPRSVAPKPPTDGSTSTAIIRVPVSNVESMGARSPSRNRWLLVAVGAVVLSTLVFIASSFAKRSATQNRSGDAQPQIDSRPSTQSSSLPIVPASSEPAPEMPLQVSEPQKVHRSALAVTTPTAANSVSPGKEPVKVTKRASENESRAPSVQSSSAPTDPASAPSNAKPVPKGTAAFDSDNSQGAGQKSTKPSTSAPPSRDYGI